jgi:hypothetical protein
VNLSDLLDEVFDVLAGVPGLTAPGAGTVRITPPAPYAELPEVTYGAHGNGLDALALEIAVYFGQPTERGVFSTALEYASTSGAKSIPAALEAHSWAACDTLYVRSAAPAVDNVSGHPLLGYVFTLDITGRP